MHLRTITHARFALVGMGFSACFQACQDPAPKEITKIETVVATDTASFTDADLDAITAQLVADYEKDFKALIVPACPDVCGKEHDLLTTASKDSFFIEKGSDMLELLPHSISIPWSHFRGRVMGNVPGSHEQRGVVFCFGLDENFEFKLGINVVILKGPVNGEWTFDDLDHATMYVVERGQMNSISRASWKTRYADPYRNSVRVLKPDGHYRSLTPCDHLEYVMPWETELMLLGDHNSDVAMSTDFVVTLGAVRTPCALDTNDVELRQIAMGHLQGYLGNAPIPSGKKEFYRRATDLGTPCPPRCGKFNPGAASNCQQPHLCP